MRKFAVRILVKILMSGRNKKMECEIVRSGILFYAVEKGKQKSVNGEYYDNLDDAYDGVIKFLRNLGTSFILTVPAELYD